MRNKLILTLTILTILFFISSVSSCINTRRETQDKDREMALRIDLEEKINKVVGKRNELKSKIKELEQLLEEGKKAHEATKKALTEEKLLNESLQTEFDKMRKLKQTIEEDLKEELIKSP